MGPIRSLDDLIDMVRRRARLLVRMIAASCVFSVLFALSQQHQFQSTEVIQIVRPKITIEQVSSNAAGSSVRQLQLIEQRLMARGNMLEIIGDFNLYLEFPDLKPSELVHRLRQSVQIHTMVSEYEGYIDDSTKLVLSITAEMSTAMQAQQVAHEVAQRALSVSIGLRDEQARETMVFFADREGKLIVRIAKLETQIADFRDHQEFAVPGSTQDRRKEITSLNEALLANAQKTILIYREAGRIARTEQSATATRKQIESNDSLAMLNEQEKLLLDRKTELEQSNGAVTDSEGESSTLKRQLQSLRGELAVVSALKSEANVAIHRESERQTGHLTVIELAPLPDYPITGSRKAIVLNGSAVGVVISLALAFMLELRNPVIRTAAQMEREVGFGPIVSIPYLDPTPRKMTLRRRFLAWLDESESSDSSAI